MRIEKILKIVVMTSLLGLCMPHILRADDAVPEYIQVQSKTPLTEVGSGTYRKYGFSVYRATLWGANGVWDDKKPYALRLHYMRSVSKETMIDVLMDDITGQAVSDDATLARWRANLTAILSDVDEGDELTALCIPGVKTTLYFNGKKITNMTDLDESRAFFNVWLGENADADLRSQLLHHI